MEKFKPIKGMRDFLPEEMIRRDYIIQTIRRVFILYGFDELQTPVLESWELLSAKCGEDLKQQIFKFKDKGGREVGLRPELTPSLARVIVSNPNLPKPFKRFCIAPVWRYEDVSRGRRREFYQCDIDIVGCKSMEADAECLACACDCLKELGLNDFQILLNNRKILNGVAELVGVPEEKRLDVFRNIDKLEKIGERGVREKLEKVGLAREELERIMKIIKLKGREECLKEMKKILDGIEVGKEGVKELEEILRWSKEYGFYEKLEINLSLARGLDYYTGPIFEIKLDEKIGSVAGGGRYDNLIEVIGGPSIPATGISLGIERIIEVMKRKDMFKLPSTYTQVFVACVEEDLKPEVIKIAKFLRGEGISCQIDLTRRKLKQQIEFADKLKIPYLIIVGKKELRKGKFKLKDMKVRKEYELDREELLKFLKDRLSVT